MRSNWASQPNVVIPNRWNSVARPPVHSEWCRLTASTPASRSCAANRSAILEFEVDDVDALHQQLGEAALDTAMPPTTMPWGNRALLLRDPDGNLINFFTPVTEDAIRRASRIGLDLCARPFGDD